MQDKKYPRDEQDSRDNPRDDDYRNSKRYQQDTDRDKFRDAPRGDRGDNRSSFGDRSRPDSRPSYGDRDNRGGDRPQGDRPRPSYGDRPQGDRPRFGGGDRPQGDRDNRPARSAYGDRDNRGGDRPRPSYGDRPQGDRPRPSYGDRDNRGERSDNRSSFGDRPRPDSRPAYGDRDNRGGDRPRPSYGDRPQGDRPQGDRPRPDSRPAYGDRDNRGGDRPRPSYGDRPQGDRPRFGGGDRPQGDRPRPSYGDRPQGDRPRFGGGDRKDFNSKPKSYSNKNFKPKHIVYNSVAHGEGYREFLPMNRADMEARGWKELDILLVSGDAYIDHPAFAAALLGRHLESHGFKVGIITQPDWRDANANRTIQEMGRPRLFAGVTAGAVDSMLAHYTAFRKKRHDDAYTPGGECGSRPNRAVAVYTNLLRQAFPNLPVVSGGIESSLRRLSHYDFWSEALRKSILADAKLDLILYGMGEKSILETAQNLQEFHRRHPELAWDGEIMERAKNKKPWQDALCHINGSARLIKCADIPSLPSDAIILPSHTEVEANPKLLIDTSLESEKHMHQGNRILVQAVDNDRAVLVERPAAPLSVDEMDALYDLPFTREAHPRYKESIPAQKMMQTSMTCHRGCGGACTFCSLALHQGRHISSRSKQSLLDEAKKIASQKSFDGAISDVGGPSANMWQAHCALEDKGVKEKCTRKSCMTPQICANFIIDQNDHLNLLRDIKNIREVNHVRVASGVRFDLALTQKSALNDYAGEFTGGQLKVAPEHCSKEVLELMRKPQMDNFETFLEAFYGYCRKMDKEQYVVPYLISAFPGCTDEHMRELAAWLQARNWKPQQVQCFVPTPGTVASAMFHAECDTNGEPLFVAKTDAQRLRQHGILMGTTVQPNDKSFYK